MFLFSRMIIPWPSKVVLPPRSAMEAETTASKMMTEFVTVRTTVAAESVQQEP